ncbi:MAG: hypothetical protein NC543_04845 [bacterium]|nr:hypothetical protein [bacterium]MCM1374866.1 hypothetical protein [Muribaculum sp.]
MKRILRNIRKSEVGIEILFALICTVLAFSIYAGQYFGSDSVTFGKIGDHILSCFPAFRKICQFFTSEQVIVGVDNGTLNGASEFFLRPNMPVIYVPLYIFAWLTKFFHSRAMYIAFFAVHMFFSVFFAQRLAKKYFGIGRYLAFVYSSLIIYLLSVESWCISFYIVTALMPVLLYFSLESVYNSNVGTIGSCVLVMVLSLTSGYITLSLAMVVVDVLFTIFYLSVREKKFDLKRCLFFLICPAVAGAICLPYYLQVLIYVKRVVQSPMAFIDAIYYKLSLSDLLNVLTNYSIPAGSGIEQLWALSFGFVACLAIAMGIKEKVFDKMKAVERWTCYLGFGAYLLIVFWANETALPFSAWLYTFVPILGGMHIPLRYLMIVLPVTYMGIMLIYKYLNAEKCRKSLKYIGWCVSGILVFYLIAYRAGVPMPLVSRDAFIFEMLVFTWFLYEAWKDGLNHYRTQLIWVVAIFVPAVSFLYQTTDVYVDGNTLRNRSIVYDEDAINNIDKFISTLNEKELYRYVAYDSEESVPQYLLSNYEWYGYSDYKLCNYYGYELSLGTPRDYLEKNPFFNVINWEYVADTRADFIMLDSSILENEEMISTMIDWNKGVAYVGNGRLICALNKFIPSVICGEKFVFDSDSSYDNGYFYSLDLTNDDVVDFETNSSTYYRLTLNSRRDSIIAFLPYANRNYHYFIDGKEIDPEIYDTQAIFRVSGGNHTISVEYRNAMGKMGVIAIFVACIMLPAVLIIYGVLVNIVKREDKKEKCV